MKERIRWVESPWFPALLSAFIAPGVGQMINRDLLKGLCLIFSFMSSILWFSEMVSDRLSLLITATPEEWKVNPELLRVAFTQLVQETPGVFMTFYLLLFLLWVYGIVDAFVSAKQKKRGI